jgi:branched-chain amino acid transport system substrate-binding protein
MKSNRTTYPFATLLTIVSGAIVVAACSSTFTPSGKGEPQPIKAGGPCTTNASCGGGGLVCNAANVCALATEDPIKLGMSVPLSGSTEELGIEMRNGVRLALEYLNSEPEKGSAGRPIILDAKDDGYEPPAAQSNAKELVKAITKDGAETRCKPVKDLATAAEIYSPMRLDRGPGAVLAMIGSVGTPTMVQAAPVALESGTIFFGAFTGAGAILRNGSAGPECSRFVFNVRTSYGSEARAALEMFVKRGVKYLDHIISFDQNDAFGNAGYNGLIAAYNNLQPTLAMANAADPNAWAALAAKPTRATTSRRSRPP